jgi:hypothetical protein
MPYDEFDDIKSEFSDDSIKNIVNKVKPELEEPKPDKITDISQFVERDKESILDDDTALSALGLLKQILHENGCILADFKIGFDSTGFDIKGVTIKCRNPRQILDKLKGVAAAPGQLKPQSLYDKMPNSYATMAILGDLKTRAGEDLGLDIRAAAYENDYVVITFFPAEEPSLPPPPPPMAMPEVSPPEETPEEKPEEEVNKKTGGPEVPDEGVPPSEIDWDALGI